MGPEFVHYFNDTTFKTKNVGEENWILIEWIKWIAI